MLPGALQPLFWDYRAESLDWDSDADLITARVLASGEWNAIQWLRRTLGDDQLRSWIEARHGRGLDVRRLRFWELILGLSNRRVTSWLREPGRQVWEQRVQR